MTPYKAIIGLGNPGRAYHHHRHTIGFRVLDALAAAHAGSWQGRTNMEYAEIKIHNTPVILIKPQTFMNDSGAVIPLLAKKGIKAEQVLVIHDELEKPFGHISITMGGSAKGHNGLRSIIQYLGMDFARLKFGIGRPERKEDVGTYVLSNFSQTEETILASLIAQAVSQIEEVYE
jgi:peptidyl-tRNA hydrolase, PTH1 family